MLMGSNTGLWKIAKRRRQAGQGDGRPGHRRPARQGLRGARRAVHRPGQLLALRAPERELDAAHRARADPLDRRRAHVGLDLGARQRRLPRAVAVRRRARRPVVRHAGDPPVARRRAQLRAAGRPDGARRPRARPRRRQALGRDLRAGHLRVARRGAQLAPARPDAERAPGVEHAGGALPDRPRRAGEGERRRRRRRGRTAATPAASRRR